MPRTKRDKPIYRLGRERGRRDWYIFWSENRRTKRRCTGTSDLDEAKRVLADYLITLETLEKSDFMVGKALEEYLAHKKRHYALCGAPKQNFKALEYSLKPIRPHFGHLRPDQVTRQAVRQYTDQRRDAGRSNATIGKELSLLSAALYHAARENRIGKAPSIELPPAPPARDKWATPDQAKEFLSHCRSHHVLLFALLALHTLSRKQAILDLTWAQVDLKHKLIDFNPPGRIATRKRRVPVPIANKRLLAALLEARELAVTDYVIEFNGEHVSNIKRGFTAAAARAKMNWMTPHVLRHTGATLMAKAGVSLWDIAGIMGDSVATVEQHYAKHHPDYLKSAVRKLDKLYG